MPINPAIALGVRPIEIQQRDPLQDYAQISSIQNAQLQNQLARQQMEQEQGVLNYLREPGKLATPEGRAGLRQFGKTGLAYEKLISEQETNALKRQELEGKLRDQRMTALGTGLTSVLADPSDANLAAAFDRLDATGVDTKPFRQQFAGMPDLAARKAAITQYVTSNPEGRQALAFVQPKPEKADLYGQTVWIDTNPNSPTYLKPVQKFEDQPLPAAVEAQKSRIAKAGATNVNVSTEKKYSEQFAGKIATEDADLRSAAMKAPEAVATADRIIDLIDTGKVITGTGANARLQFAKALNLAGSNDAERISNTEVLVSALAETTLGAIKSSNLGAGQGFTNADREFLGKAKAGEISYEAKSLRRVAELSRKASEFTVEKWNKRVKQIPASALEGTGITTEPVVVPPRKTSSVMNIPSAAIQALQAGQGTPEQFDAVFGAGSAARVLGKGK